MKVLHIITGLETGGAEMMLLKVAMRLKQSAIQSEVISLMGKGTIGARLEEAGIAVHDLRINGLAGVLQAPFTLKKIAAKFIPDVIQGWMYHGNLAARLLVFAPAIKAPVVWNIRQSLQSSKNEKAMTALIIKICALISKKPSSIIYNSITAANDHEKKQFYSSRRIIIPNGFDTEIFKPDSNARANLRRALGIAEGAIVVGLVARYHPMKDHATFFKAARQVLKQQPEVHFILAGRGIDPGNAALSSLITGNFPAGRLHLLGERADMPELTAGLDIAVNASAWGEAFPNAIGEAMACAVPCIATDVGDSAAIIANPELIVPIADVQSLATAMEKLINMGPEKRQELGIAARKRIVDFYSIDAIAGQYSSLYARLLSGLQEG